MTIQLSMHACWPAGRGRVGAGRGGVPAPACVHLSLAWREPVSPWPAPACPVSHGVLQPVQGQIMAGHMLSGRAWLQYMPARNTDLLKATTSSVTCTQTQVGGWARGDAALTDRHGMEGRQACTPVTPSQVTPGARPPPPDPATASGSPPSNGALQSLCRRGWWVLPLHLSGMRAGKVGKGEGFVAALSPDQCL